MKKAQKVIKYLAIAFGLYLAINIIGGIVFGATLLLGIDMGLNAISEVTEVNVMDYEESFSDIEKLDIKINAADFEIKIGEALKVVLKDVNEKTEVKAQGKTLKIADTKMNWNIVSNKKPAITLYIPEGMAFNEAKIEMGAGKVEKNQTVGSGENKIKIEGGIGEIQIKM